MAPDPANEDQQIDTTIGRLLQVGVTISALVVALAGIFYLMRYGASPVELRVYRGEPSFVRTLAGIIHGAVALRRRDLIMVGILILIATPVARVIFSIWAFARERDWLYVGLTLVVLAILLFSMLFGRRVAG